MDYLATLQIVASVVGSIVTVAILPLIRTITEHTVRRANKMIIGIPSGSILPPALEKLPDYTDYKKALHSEFGKVVLHCRTLSFALRKCDFVVYEGNTDPKVHSANDKIWESIVE